MGVGKEGREGNIVRTRTEGQTPERNFEFDLKTPTQVGLNIYDAKGQLIKTFESMYFGSGIQRIIWNLNEDNVAEYLKLYGEK